MESILSNAHVKTETSLSRSSFAGNVRSSASWENEIGREQEVAAEPAIDSKHSFFALDKSLEACSEMIGQTPNWQYAADEISFVCGAGAGFVRGEGDFIDKSLRVF